MSMNKPTHGHSNCSLNFVIVHIGPKALDHQFSLALLAVHTLQIWQVFAADCDSSGVLQTAVALSALSLLYCSVLDLLYLIKQRSDSSSSTCMMQCMDMVDPLTMHTV